MACDEVNGNNVMESMLIIEVMCIPHALIIMFVKHTWTYTLVSVGYYCSSSTVRSRTGLVDQGSYTDGRGPTSRFIVWASVRMCHAYSAHLWW